MSLYIKVAREVKKVWKIINFFKLLLTYFKLFEDKPAKQSVTTCSAGFLIEGKEIDL